MNIHFKPAHLAVLILTTTATASTPSRQALLLGLSIPYLACTAAVASLVITAYGRCSANEPLPARRRALGQISADDAFYLKRESSPQARPRLEITKHHQGFAHVHPPGLPLARLLPQTEQGPLGFHPGLRTPTDKTRRRTPGRGSILNTDRKLRTRHDRPPTCESTRYARLRVARENFPYCYQGRDRQIAKLLSKLADNGQV